MFSQSLSSLLGSQFIHFSLSGVWHQDLWKSLYTDRNLILGNSVEYFIFGHLKQRCQQNSQNSKGNISTDWKKITNCNLLVQVVMWTKYCLPGPTVQRTLAFNKSSKVCLIFNRWVFTVGASESPYYTRPSILTVTTKFQTNHSSPNRSLKSQV